MIGCGGVIKKPNISISPPPSNDDESNYDHNNDCKWVRNIVVWRIIFLLIIISILQVIVAPPGQLIELSFKSFDLEATHDCFADSLKIYDDIVVSENDAVQPIATHCGTNKPPIMLSTSRAFTLIFHSDESVNGEGFLATYQFIDGQNCKETFLHVSVRFYLWVEKLCYF